LVFEWILLLEIQTNCKNWVWKEKSVEPSMCPQLPNLEIFNSKNVKNKECVHMGPMAQATLVLSKDQILPSNWKNHQLGSSIFHEYPNK
jgi:hypothetical protein